MDGFVLFYEKEMTDYEMVIEIDKIKSIKFKEETDEE